MMSADTVVFDSRSAGHRLRSLGLSPIFYNRGEKQSYTRDWQLMIPVEGEDPEKALPTANVGIHLRFGLADVDLDSEETRLLADDFLPMTSFTFGRTSTPRSHRLYRASVLKSMRFIDPVAPEGKRAMLVELRTAGSESGGVQSLCYGVHPNGDTVRFVAEGTPAEVPARDLSRAVAALASASLLARHFKPGTRNDAGMALCHWLLEAGVEPDVVQRIVRGVAKACVGPEPETQRRMESAFDSTIEKIRDGDKVMGRSTLVNKGFFDVKMIERVEQWLEVKRATDSTDQSRRFTFISDDDDLAIVSSPTPSYLGDGVIPQSGLVVAAGAAGVAKTLFATTMGYHLATGRDFLGLKVARPVKVLYIEAESNRDAYARRRRAIRAACGITGEVPNLILLGRADPTPQIGPELSGLVAECGAEVVILDTVGYFYHGNENDNSDLKNKVVKPLRDMMRTLPSKPAVFVNHHFAKKTEGVSGASRMRGGSALPDDSNTTITFDKKEDVVVVSFPKIKDGPPLADLTLKVDYFAAKIELLEGTAAAVAQEQRVLKVAELTPADVAITTKNLVTLLGQEMQVAETKAKELISKAVKAELIERVGRGEYRRAGSEAPSVGRSESVN